MGKVIFRDALAKTAKGLGWKGASLPELKQWMDDEGREFVMDGETVDVEKSWAKTKTVTISVTADAGEDVVVEDGASEMEGESMDGEEEPMPKGGRRAAFAAERGQKDFRKTFAETTKPRTVRDFAAESGKKAYNRAANSGTLYKGYVPVFADADRAEVFGAAFRLSVMGDKPYSQKARDRDIIGVKTSGTTSVNEWGGSLVVSQVGTEVIDLLHNFGATRQLAGVTNMPDGSWQTPRKTTNMSFSFVGETDSISETNPAYDRVQLTAHKLAGIARLSNELLNDSAFNIADEVARSAAAGAAFAEDSCYFNGTGLATHAGLAGDIDANSTYDAALSSSWDDYTIAKLQNWLGKIPAEAWRSGTVQIACSTAFYQSVLLRFAMSAGGNVGSDLQNGFQGNLRWSGVPVILSEVLPSTYTGDQIVAYAGSFKRGTKFGVVSGSEQISTSDQAYWTTDEFGFRYTERIAFNNHDVGGTSSEVIALQD